MENQKPLYVGNVQNKQQKELIGEIRLYKQKKGENANAPQLRGFVRINAKKAIADDKGYVYLQVAVWEQEPETTKPKK